MKSPIEQVLACLEKVVPGEAVGDQLSFVLVHAELHWWPPLPSCALLHVFFWRSLIGGSFPPAELPGFFGLGCCM